MPQATYSDNKTKAQVGDRVYGITPAGAPIGGRVAEVDHPNLKVRVVPAVQDAVWCNASDHTKAS